MKKFRRLCMSLIIMMLTVAMLVGTMSFSAFALEVGADDTQAIMKYDVHIASKVKYNASFDVPEGVNGATVTVTAPNGKTVTRDEGKVLANQVGTYTVTYSVKGKDAEGNDKDYTYDFNVYSYVENEYSINVANGGADVPTYAATGADLKLPAAALVYTDEDGNLQTESATVVVKTSDLADPLELTAATETEAAHYKYKPASAGNVYVTYYAYLGEGGTRVYTKDFVIKVQDNFTDTQKPTLSVVNVTTNSSLNRKLTLPTASATDNFDANVKIEINVTDPSGNPVKEVDVNDDDYAEVVEGKEYAKVEFDNNKVMSFYPTELGKYKVTYQAVDDFGNRSAMHNYTVEVSDTTAPVFKSIDEHAIPANWGLTVNGDAAAIKFPTPVVVDNAGNENLTVALKVSDSENNTVVNFTNILAEDSSYTGTDSSYGTKGETYKFSEFNFDFNFVNTANKTGDFNVEYAARDSKGNRSTRTFKINVVESYTDDVKPEASIVDAPQYFAVTDEVDSFMVPAVSTSDRGDSHPQVTYVLESESDSANKFEDLEGGETLDIDGSGAEIYLVKGDKKVKIDGGKKITLTLTVKDNVDLEATDTAEIMVFSSTQNNENLSLDTTGINLKKTYYTKETANLGGFTVNVGDEKFRKFTGYELSITAPDGGLVPEVASEFYYDTETNKLNVREINFTPNTVGVYQITVRAFDLSGTNIVKTGLFNVERGKDDIVVVSAATLTRTGSIRTAYTFRNEKFTIQNPIEGAKYFPSYKVVGSSFSVMGLEFTAHTASSYRISEGYVLCNEVSGAVSTLSNETIKETYTVNFSDESDARLEIQGVMPTYSKVSKNEDKQVVTIPSIVAYSENGNGKVDVSVKLSKGGAVKVDYNEDTNERTFEPKKDGEYTITVTGTVNGKTVTAEYKMNVGDVEGPKFSVTAPSNNAVVGRDFEFSVVTLDSATTDSINECTFTKRLVDPSGDVVSEATISGTGKTYADRTKNSNTTVTLSKSGNYEVVYIVTDNVGNETVQKYSITVTAKTNASRVSIAAISTVLIVVGVVLIAAVILYFVLFRKRKAKN